ncbi:MAG TPA: aminopeptidase P family protein [Rhodothermales bacterium]|nr:aminopeptidase P family protein [Rhodothermales bacterium]
MFSAEVYQRRRQQLQQQLDGGLVVLLGNDESPMNYRANPYPFRQDSDFIYFVGADWPGLAAVIDVDAGSTTLFGNDLSLDDIVWMGPHPTVAERAERSGIEQTAPWEALSQIIKQAANQGRVIHYPPPYRADNTQKLAAWLGCSPDEVLDGASLPLITAIVAQRSVKSDAEITAIEEAIGVAHAMHTAVMREAKAGMTEAEIAGLVEGIAIAGGGRLSFPLILSNHGEILHNHHHTNTLQRGDLVVCDGGAAIPSYYASDITRTFPIGGSFSTQQAEIYQIVLDAQEAAIAATRPDVLFRDVHLLAARHLTEGLKGLGLMRGDIDEAVAAGAHALFFPHGLGHMMGLDVHDMEGLGEDHVGYDDEIQRSNQFGLSALRLGKRLQPGYVVTVEPGLYFIPALIDQWQADNQHADFIDYDRVADFRDFGGVRIEDDVLVTEDGLRILGPPIPKHIDEVEALLADS